MSPSIEPFDEVKYKALMDGLECGEILKSSVALNTLGFRLDASLYIKSIIEKEIAIKLQDHFFLKKNEVFTGPFGSTLTAPSHMESGFIPLVRSININQGFYINRNDLVFITEEDNEKIKHSQLYEDDIVLSRVGSIGYFARVDSLLKTCNISSNNIGIRLANYERTTKHYILTFLNTRTANQLVVRLATGNVQPKLTTKDMCLIPIPAFSSEYYTLISKLVDKSEDAIVQAEESYKEAERILATAIDIRGINQVSPVKAEKHLSDSFGKSGRLDAEYYQPKYDEYLEKLHEFETTSIPAEYDVFKNSGTDYADGANDVGVIKTKQLGNNGIDIDGVESYFTIQTCIENKSTYLKKNDVVFASMGVGSLGKVSLFSCDGNKQFVTDSTLRIYRAKTSCRVLPEVLCVFLQSHLGQEMIYRYVVGSTGIINIYDDAMAKIPIPILDMDVQKEIATKVQESFALRTQSKQLLENAKQAVEMAIEQGEDAALEWLKDKED